MEKAKAFRKNLLLRATGAIETSEEDEGRNHRQTKASYYEVVTRPPGRRPNGNDNGQVSMKTRINNLVQSGNSNGNSLGKTKFTQKLFSAEYVAKLVELARNQLRKDTAAKSGWIEAETKEKMRQEKLYARELVQDFQRSPESELRCWQCNISALAISALHVLGENGASYPIALGIKERSVQLSKEQRRRRKGRDWMLSQMAGSSVDLGLEDLCALGNRGRSSQRGDRGEENQNADSE